MMREIKIYEGEFTIGRVVYTIKDNHVYKGDLPIGRAVYTIKDNHVYKGDLPIGRAVYAIKDNHVYKGDLPIGRAVYTIKDNHVYKGDLAVGRVIYTLKIFKSNDYMEEDNKKYINENDNTIIRKEKGVIKEKNNDNTSNGGGCLSVIVFFIIIIALAVSGNKGDGKKNKESVVEQVKSEYVFEDSDSRYLTDEEVMNLSKKKIRYAINEIYARRGRIFKDKKLNKYFSKKSWYEPKYTQEQFDESVFNEYERANINLLSKYR